MEWREIPLPALDNVRSTGAAQPLPRELWPTWAHDKPDFVGVWFMPLDAPLNTSTESLTPSGAQASLDPERIDSGSTTPLVYYRYVYCQMTDGRTFQLGPMKKLEYERHREERPSWSKSYKSASR
jgi:hypothetical protein